MNGVSRIALHLAFALPVLGKTFAAPAAPPVVEARAKPLLTVDRQSFRDVNANDRLDAYEDWRLPVKVRVSDLIARLTIEEKAGLMLHASVQGFTGPQGIVLDQRIRRSVGGIRGPELPAVSELIGQRHIRWLLLRATEAADVAARAANAVQELAEATGLGIPVVLSSDPRHSANPGAADGPQAFSVWPEAIGFAAIGDPAVVREFGRIGRAEYRAIGLHAHLGPMADIATEPRWARIPGTFGEEPAMVGKLTNAYVEGFQGGAKLGSDGVLCVTKHWPGHGPVKDGLDPHLDYGRWQVYPGNNFDAHVEPFRAAIASGTAGIMPGYAIPNGKDTVGMNFSKIIVGDLLRRREGFDGLVLTDWLKHMPWGVENLSEKERHRFIVEAGRDQIGGEDDPSQLIALMQEQALSAARVDDSMRRILRPMFQMGLFENPYVDPERAKAVASNARFVRAGLDAQRRSVVLLKNANSLLPLASRTRVYAENFDREAVARCGVVVDNVSTADVALIKVRRHSPFTNIQRARRPKASSRRCSRNGSTKARSRMPEPGMPASLPPSSVSSLPARPWW